MKKILSIIICLVFLIPTFILSIPHASAKTLGDLEKELAETKADKAQKQQEEKLTKEQMATITAKVAKIQDDIALIEQDMINLEAEIKQLNLDILSKDDEIKKLMNFNQKSDGIAVYIEYLFGARDFADFIYRISVTEQLAKYNSNLVTEYNSMIEQNQTKTVNLKKLEIKKDNDQKELKGEYDTLGSRISDIYEDYHDLNESIKVQEQTIAMYKNKGCKSTDEVPFCGRDVIPADYAFWRPLNSAWITSDYGYRTHPVTGKLKFHTGLDMSAGGGTKVYAIASGVVSSITYKSSCGGTYIFVHHYINGKYYTSLYMHLRKVLVNKGDLVTKNSVIATSGGTSKEYWDKCSTGGHLHLTTLKGLVGVDYSAWSSGFYTNLISPRSVINFPSGYGYFSNRTTKY